MTDWSRPETLWLNVTNAVLGLVTVVAFAAVLLPAVKEAFGRARARRAAEQADPHTLALPELGLTMADGGEKVDGPRQH